MLLKFLVAPRHGEYLKIGGVMNIKGRLAHLHKEATLIWRITKHPSLLPSHPYSVLPPSSDQTIDPWASRLAASSVISAGTITSVSYSD